MKNIVEKEWLHERLFDSNIRIADCRFTLGKPEEGRKLYLLEHIPGAVYFDLEKDLSGPVKEHGGRHPLPDMAAFKHVIESAGIDRNKIVVAYDDGSGAFAARFWWMLKYVGHESVYVLNGGFNAWKEYGFPINNEVPQYEQANFEMNPNRDIYASYEDVKKVVSGKDSRSVLIDSREEKRFLGIEEPIDKKAGHIPGAINMYWTEPLIELIPQFDLVKEIVEAFDVPNIGLEGFEADDCIGTLAKQRCQDADVLILTGDQDILQLIDENISVALLKKGFGNYHVYTKESFFEEKGIHPQQMIDVKALMGDSSDNYPGVRGIGEKTALKLVQQYQNIEGIISNLENLTKAQRTRIEQDLDMLHLSRKLAEIKCDAPVTCSLDDALFQIDRQKVIDKFKELEFRGLHTYLEFEKEYA